MVLTVGICHPLFAGMPCCQSFFGFLMLTTVTSFYAQLAELIIEADHYCAICMNVSRC